MKTFCFLASFLGFFRSLGFVHAPFYKYDSHGNSYQKFTKKTPRGGANFYLLAHSKILACYGPAHIHTFGERHYLWTFRFEENAKLQYPWIEIIV